MLHVARSSAGASLAKRGVFTPHPIHPPDQGTAENEGWVVMGRWLPILLRALLSTQQLNTAPRPRLCGRAPRCEHGGAAARGAGGMPLSLLERPEAKGLLLCLASAALIRAGVDRQAVYIGATVTCVALLSGSVTHLGNRVGDSVTHFGDRFGDSVTRVGDGVARVGTSLDGVGAGVRDVPSRCAVAGCVKRLAGTKPST
jgi:hypothetical protein